MSDHQFSKEKNFSSFFWPFFDSESFKSKKKKFWKFLIFLKNLTQNDPFWPKFGAQFGQKGLKIFFFWFFRALNMKNDRSYDKISLILIFGHFRSKKSFLGLKGAERGHNFGQNDLNLFHRFSCPKAIKNDGSYDKIRQNLKKWIFGSFWDR